MNAIAQVLAVQVALNGVNQVLDGLANVARSIDNTNSKIIESARAGAAWVAAAAAIGLGSLRAYESFERFRRGLQAQLGTEEGARLAEQIEDLAAASKFGSAELRKAAQYALSLGTAADKVVPLTKAVSDLVGAGGGGTFEVQGAIRATAQISATGRVMAQDFDQLVNAAVPLGLIAEELGVTTAHLRTGGVAADEFIAAMMRVSSRVGSQDLLPTEQLSNFIETIQRGLIPTGRMVGNMISGIISFVQPLVEMFFRLNEITGGWLTNLLLAVIAINGIAKFIPILTSITAWMKGLLSIQVAYNFLVTQWGAIVGIVQKLIGFLKALFTWQTILVAVETTRAFLAAAMAAAVGNIPGAIAAVALIAAAGIGAAVAWNKFNDLGNNAEKNANKPEPAQKPSQRPVRRDDMERLYDRMWGRTWTG